MILSAFMGISLQCPKIRHPFRAYGQMLEGNTRSGSTCELMRKYEASMKYYIMSDLDFPRRNKSSKLSALSLTDESSKVLVR